MAKDRCNTTTVWVAIDVAKRWNEVLVEISGTGVRRFKVANRLEDFEKLAEYLSRWGAKWCRIGIEPTGNYHRPLAHYLKRQGFEVCFVSSLGACRAREIWFNSWDKNDPKDAEVILKLLKQGAVQFYHDPLLHGIHDLQELSKTYYQISLNRTRLLHSLQTHYLPLYFPEAERYLHSTRAAGLIRTLLRFPVPRSITQYDFEKFAQRAWDVVGRKVNKRQWLHDFYCAAQESVALPVEEDSLGVETFRIILREYLRINELRSELESMAKTQLADHADFQRLRTLPGIGPILALTILAEAGDLRRFRHHRQFLKFCGLDLATYQSGSSKGQSHLSKRGNARLRQAFWMAATVAIRQRENSFRTKYENYIRPDPKNADLRRKAYTAVAAKMARVAYALIKHNADYRCYYEAAIPSGKIPFVAAVGAAT